MADPLSIAAAIAGLVTTGVAIVKGIYTVSDAFASSGREIRAYGDEMDRFTKLLNLVYLELTRTAHINSNVIIFREIADVCAGVFEPFNRLQKTLVPLISRLKLGGSRWKVIQGKILWIFEKKKELLFWRDVLAQQHRNLDSALLVLVMQGNREGTAQIKHILEASLRKSIREIPIAEDYSVSVEEVQSVILPRSEASHLGESGLRDSVSELDQPITTAGEDIEDSAVDIEAPEDLTASIYEQSDPVPFREVVQQLALTTLNNENSLIPWTGPESLTMEEFDEVIQGCLDPDDGIYMRLTEEHVAQMSLMIEEIAVQALHTQGQNAFDNREQAIALNGGRYIVGIVCAFPFQFVAVRSMMTEIQPPSMGNTFPDSVYVFGRIANHEVALTCLPNGGHDGRTEHEAFRIFKNMFRNMPSIPFAISIGTASACPTPHRDIRLADVVIGRPQKTGEAILRCSLDGESHYRSGARLPDVLSTGIRILEAQHMSEDGKLADFIDSALKENSRMDESWGFPGYTDRLFNSSYSHQDEEGTCHQCDVREMKNRQARRGQEPRLHYGTIASVQSEIKDPVFRDEIARKFGVLCIDSEGSEISCELPVLVVRGIIDYADSHAGPHWQRHAALAAAAYVKELLTVLPQGS